MDRDSKLIIKKTKWKQIKKSENFPFEKIKWKLK